MEEENEKLGLQMRNDFMKRCENIEDVLAVYKKETHALLQSVKDDVGKSNCKSFLRISRSFETQTSQEKLLSMNKTSRSSCNCTSYKYRSIDPIERGFYS